MGGEERKQFSDYFTNKSGLKYICAVIKNSTSPIKFPQVPGTLTSVPTCDQDPKIQFYAKGKLPYCFKAYFYTSGTLDLTAIQSILNQFG